MIEAEIARAHTSLSSGCGKILLKALHAGILDAVERIVLSTRLDPFSKADLTRENSGNFSDVNRDFFDPSRTKITESTHSRCVQLCDEVSDFSKENTKRKAAVKVLHGSFEMCRNQKDALAGFWICGTRQQWRLQISFQKKKRLESE
jgi:hypothetical protein